MMSWTFFHQFIFYLLWEFVNGVNRFFFNPTSRQLFRNRRANWNKRWNSRIFFFKLSKPMNQSEHKWHCSGLEILNLLPFWNLFKFPGVLENSGFDTFPVDDRPFFSLQKTGLFLKNGMTSHPRHPWLR